LSQQQQQLRWQQSIPTDRSASPNRLDYNKQRKCAENHNKRHNEFIFFNLQLSFSYFLNHNSFRVLFDKIASVYLFEKYIYILVLEMTSTGNQHCASCIGTLSFPVISPR